jgi:hypothetical protein
MGMSISLGMNCDHNRRFNVYTAQPVIKSGCVLRRANVGVLEREALVTTKEVEACKRCGICVHVLGELSVDKTQAIRETRYRVHHLFS